MKTNNKLIKTIVAGLASSLMCIGFTAPVSAASVNLDQLLNEIRQGRAADASTNQQRMTCLLQKQLVIETMLPLKQMTEK